MALAQKGLLHTPGLEPKSTPEGDIAYLRGLLWQDAEDQAASNLHEDMVAERGARGWDFLAPFTYAESELQKS